MNVYNKITDYLGEGSLPKGAKKINSRLVYVLGTTFHDEKVVTVWEQSAKGVWTEWWTMDPATFKREFGKSV